MNGNNISYFIRGVIFKGYKNLGLVLLESFYVTALRYELLKEFLEGKTEVPIPGFYENEKLEVGFRLDMLIENKVIIEVKSVQNLVEIHHKQVLT
jgi:GxxExxY protein